MPPRPRFVSERSLPGRSASFCPPLFGSPGTAGRLAGRLAVWAVLIAAVFWTGCSSSSSLSMNEDPSAYREETRRLKERLTNDPGDAQALRELGAIYVRTGQPSKAYDRLKTAYSRVPTDPKTMFFLGLASERVGKRKAALRLFQRFDEVPEDSRYRSLMRGRYEWLVRQDARQQIRDLVAQERSLPTDRIASDAVAVLPLQYNGTADRYQPLGRGLAEMMTADLAKVERLRVVERVRLQALLDELKLAQSRYVDPSTAPDIGKLLGAGRLVGGSYFVTDDNRIQLTLDLASVADGGSVRSLTNEQADLSQLFRLQTALVFDLVRSLGIDLTPRERDAIETVPTRDLQAFLAYSRGLLEEDRGNFGAAQEQFQRAQSLDAGFQEAARGADRTSGLVAAAGPTAKSVNAAVPARQSSAGRRLVNRRMRSMMGLRRGSLPGTRRRVLLRPIFVLEDALPLPPPAPSAPSSVGGS